MKLAALIIVFFACSAHSQTMISDKIELTYSFTSVPFTDSTERQKVEVNYETFEPSRDDIVIVDFPDFPVEYELGTNEFEIKLSETLKKSSKELKKQLRKHKAYTINILFCIKKSGEAMEIEFIEPLESNLEYDLAEFLLNSKWLPGEHRGAKTKFNCTLRLNFRKTR